ncbi:MAG: PHP domain-containing protein, partial [Clostridia bacterium]
MDSNNTIDTKTPKVKDMDSVDAEDINCVDAEDINCVDAEDINCLEAEDINCVETEDINCVETEDIDGDSAKTEDESKRIEEIKTEEKPKEKEKSEEKKRPETKPYVPLHLHSEYSLLDGAARITSGKHSPLLEACVEKGMPGCALTDHGNMFGVYTFYKKAKNAGIKPIIGCEFYVSSDMHSPNSERCHLVLLAKTTAGYRNLVKIDSLAYTEGFYYKPRIDIAL